VLAPGYGDDAGVVSFSNVPVGQATTLEIPVTDSVGQDVTFTSGSLTGTGAAAFQILSTFPIAVTTGSPATVQVQFAPGQTGNFAATLVLDTASMGDTSIPVQGTGAMSGDAG